MKAVTCDSPIIYCESGGSSGELHCTTRSKAGVQVPAKHSIHAEKLHLLQDTNVAKSELLQQVHLCKAQLLHSLWGVPWHISCVSGVQWMFAVRTALSC